jgi:uroporphyrinogen III methyltransferase/synthase
VSPGFVSLIGAGPGDPGLITVKALGRLLEADVIVHDRLIDPELLRSARPGALVIDAGKAPGANRMTQDQINALLVEHGRAGRMVARLKGGDPFVFGRGGEEAAALARARIPFEVVPGVTSAVAGPAYAGIPVTDRRAASSVAFATGTPQPGGADTVQQAAGADTVVVLMGIANLEGVVEKLQAGGKSARTPAAIVERATFPTQRVLTGTLGTIAARAREAGVTNPALLVVGEVVRLRRELAWFDRRPLFGKAILVTRARDQAGELSERLRALGAIPVEAPAISTAPAPRGRLDRSVQQAAAGEYEWVVFTSPNGVRYWFERAREVGFDARGLRAQVAAIGPGTAGALAQRGIVANLVPKRFTSEALAKAFPRGTGKVLLARTDIAPPGLKEAVEAKGWTVKEVVAYRTLRVRSLPAEARALLKAGRIDALAFTSASTVDGFVRMAGTIPNAGPRPKVVAIGPATAEAAAGAGLRPDAVARPHTLDGLVRAIVRTVGAKTRT